MHHMKPMSAVGFYTINRAGLKRAEGVSEDDGPLWLPYFLPVASVNPFCVLCL